MDQLGGGRDGSADRVRRANGPGSPKSKLRRPNGPPVPSSAAVADQTGHVLSEREPDWLERLVSDPASFATIEREVHEQARRQADLYVAGLLANARRPETARPVDQVVASAEVPLRPVEKQGTRDRPPPGRLGDHGDVLVLFAAGAWRQRAWTRRQWAQPRVGGLSDYCGLSYGLHILLGFGSGILGFAGLGI